MRRLRNYDAREKLSVSSLEEIISHYRDQWLQHVDWMDGNYGSKKILVYRLKARDLGRPRKYWADQIWSGIVWEPNLWIVEWEYFYLNLTENNTVRPLREVPLPNLMLYNVKVKASLNKKINFVFLSPSSHIYLQANSFRSLIFFHWILTEAFSEKEKNVSGSIIQGRGKSKNNNEMRAEK